MNFVLREEDCDGLISFLETLRYGAESKLMRAVLIEWFQEQFATQGADASIAANNLIQKYEILFLQQKHSIQAADGEFQPKKRSTQLGYGTQKLKLETETTSIDLPHTAMNFVPAKVEQEAIAAKIVEIPVMQAETTMPQQPSSPPPALAVLAGEVNVDDILGL